MSSVKILTLQKEFAFAWRQVSMDPFVNTLLLVQPNGLVIQLQSNIMVELLHTHQEVSQDLNIALMKFTLLTDSSCNTPVVMEYVLPVYLSMAASCVFMVFGAFGSMQMTCIVRIIFCPQLKSQLDFTIPFHLFKATCAKMDRSVLFRDFYLMPPEEAFWLIWIRNLVNQ